MASKLIRWVPKPNELSRRVPSKDIKSGVLLSPFYVQEGTEALLFQKGRLVGRLAAGEQQLTGNLRNLFLGDQHSEMYIIRAGGFDADLGPIDAYSNDNYPMSFALRLRIAINDPETAFREFLQGRDTQDGERTITTDELAAAVLESAKTPVQMGVQKHAAIDLATNADGAMIKAAADLPQSSLGERVTALGFKIDATPILAAEDIGQAADLLDASQAAALHTAKAEIDRKIQDDEFDREEANTARAYRRQLLNIAHTQAIEIAKAKHGDELDDIRRSGTLKDAQTDRLVDRERADTQEYRDQLAEDRNRRLREDEQRRDKDKRADKLETYEKMKRIKSELAKGATIAELIAMGLGDPEILERLAKTENYKDMSAEQIREAERYLNNKN